MKKTIIIIIFAAWTASSLAQEIDKEAVAAAEVTRYVEHWSRNIPPRFRRNALKHVSSVVHWSIYYELDPLLVATTISLESSWDRKAIGHDGEVGLMQMLNKKAMKGCDMKNPDEQVRCGCRLMRACIDKCGSIRAGVNKFATGECNTPWSKLNYRIRVWRRAVKRFRK